MNKNKILLMILVGMLPIVVISFVFKKSEANFNLDQENKEQESSLKEDSDNLELEDKQLSMIRVLVKDEAISLPLEDYIVGVVAGEMPASFNIEALKAQAVASRTYALYKKKTNENGEYDLTDNVNNQVYITEEDMRKKWGDDYQKYYDKIRQAVLETNGEVITYEGSIIEAFYFAMSAGNTQDSISVFSENRDYLQGVESKYDNDSLRDYEKEQSFSKEEFKSRLSLNCNDVVVDKIDYNEFLYVDNISICSKEFKGTEFRKLLGLRSANFKVDVGKEVSIVTKGYGHGVGMSQYGANGYARNGYTYEDILKHYYTGVEITKLEI